MIIGDIGHQLPALLADLELAFGLADLGDIILRLEQRAQECGKFRGAATAGAERLRNLVVILHANQLSGEMQQIARVLRTEHLDDDRRGRLHIFHRVVAISLLQPRPWPAVDRQRRRGSGIELRRLEVAREHQALIELERMIVFAVIALEAVLAVDALLGADEAEPEIAERDTVVGVPAAQHGARDFARHATDRSALPNPARRRIADPGLAVGLVHVFDMHAADPVGEIVISRGRDRRWQAIEAELLQAGQEALLLLAAKHPEDELRRIGGAAPRDDGEDQPGEEGVIEIGDATPLPPLRLARVLISAHVPLPVAYFA